MKRVKVVRGEKKGRYRQVGIEEIVGKTIEAVGVTTVPSNDGDEPCTILYFTDKTCHGFVHPANS
jgi:hypothetical protein